VIAGSPGWTLECSDIYYTAIEHKTPIYLIGIGAGSDAEGLAQQISSNSAIADALTCAVVVICRDEIARGVAEKYASEVKLLPCPAVANGLWLGAGWPSAKRVALGAYYDGPCDDNGVAHQITDLVQSQGRAFYSSDMTDYLAIYRGAQEVVSSRLHASVLRHAFGMPVTNIWPDSDFRCKAAWDVLGQGTRSGITSVLEEYIRILRIKQPTA
jgi:hypothetical protein